MVDQAIKESLININTLIAGVLSLVGVLLGACLAHFFTWRRNDRERFLNAYDAFCDAFANAFRLLENTDKIHVEVILDEFPKHEVAMYIFRKHLDFFRRWIFDRKWKQYKAANEHYKKYKNLINSFKSMEAPEEQTYRQKVLRLLGELLDVAKKY
jgi:hypothetical protein